MSDSKIMNFVGASTGSFTFTVPNLTTNSTTVVVANTAKAGVVPKPPQMYRATIRIRDGQAQGFPDSVASTINRLIGATAVVVKKNSLSWVTTKERMDSVVKCLGGLEQVRNVGYPFAIPMDGVGWAEQMVVEVMPPEPEKKEETKVAEVEPDRLCPCGCGNVFVPDDDQDDDNDDD